MTETAPLLDPEKRDELAHQLRLELAIRYAKAKDILNWGRVVMPHKFNAPFCPELHGYFVDIRHEAFTNTKAPRGHAKTTIKCNLIPMFQALEEPADFLHYLNVQNTEAKALDVNRAIKNEFEENAFLRELYGDVQGLRWTDAQIVVRHGDGGARWEGQNPWTGREVVFTAASTGQAIRGLNYRNIRPDYVIADDIYTDDDIHNPDSTKKINEWVMSALLQVRTKTRRSCFHLQGTAINLHSLLEILEKNPRWRSRTFRAIKDWETKTILWPTEQNTWESLMADKHDMGTVVFNRELQNVCTDDAESKIKRAWIKLYDPHELRKREDRAYSFVERRFGNDPSVGNSKTKDGRPVDSDFNGLVETLVYAYADGRGNDHYITRISNERLSMLKRIELLEKWAADAQLDHNGERPVSKVRIEANGAFDDYAQEVIRKTNLPVERVKQVKDKLTVLENKSHYFENGKVYISTDIDPELREILILQLTTNFPDHDDVRDGALLTLDDQSATWGFVR